MLQTTSQPVPLAAIETPAVPADPVPGHASDLVHLVINERFADDPEYQRFVQSQTPRTGLVDLLFATPAEPHEPEVIFKRLRWGGVFVFVSRRRRDVMELMRRCPSAGFMIEEGPAHVRRPVWGMHLPLLSRKVYYFTARKVLLIAPGEITDRFTYQVQLVHENGPGTPLVVLKEVPSLESVVTRLSRKFPEVAIDVIEKRAKKFVERIFPTFLTREAGILMILQENLPREYQNRVPRVIDMEQDSRGFVTRLRMTWLRNGGPPLPHLEFARQSADLLRAIHDVTHVIHLDLRLDNFVITENGVGFVDFGSSVREGEDLSRNPLLSSLFDELMRTSQIQKMLERMTLTGHVTSSAISQGYQKIDKSADFFYLAVQFNSPHSNPDLAELIDYDPNSRDAKDLAKLTAEILRPADPKHPTFKSAKDILHGVERIQLGLDRRR